MSTLSAIQNRLENLLAEKNCPITAQIIAQLEQQNYQGQLASTFIAQCCRTFNLSTTELALYCVAIAACYAQVPVSHFYVGAVAIGRSGTFYFGANQEFSSVAIQQTIHAEQSAISHAWLAGEKAITDMAVNTTPCGHCRQFMNELNSADSLQIHLPHSRNNSLHDYLPDAFGPKNLNIEHLLFDEQPHQFQMRGDELIKSAILAAQQSYAPYSGAMSGVALQA
ncbi:MAG TPA: cytidine deaminase, partial [Pasteurellaceae bacterium]|nr:cytidine deaminase [Pasteurellaceae bacterium]